MESAVDLIELAGIGPVLAARLGELGVFTTHDLLRVDRRRLAAIIPGASLAQVRAWQAVARLLEVKGIHLAGAERLHAGGIQTLDEFVTKTPAELRAVLAGGLVAAVAPGDDDLIEWLKDAVRLIHTGVLNGTVVSGTGVAISGVDVRCNGQRARTDARGRFRITRLGLGVRHLVHLAHADHVQKTIETRGVVPHGALSGQRFRLARGRATQPGPRVLSEIKGDRLPALGSAPVSARVEDQPPGTNDILRVVDWYENGDLKVASRLLDFEDGAFRVRAYRIAKAALPAGLATEDDLRWKNGRWTRARITERQLAGCRRLIRERKRWTGAPATDAELEQRLRGVLEAISDHPPR